MKTEQSEPEDGLVGEWKVAPLRRTKLVLRVRAGPDPSRGTAGVLRGLDMLRGIGLYLQPGVSQCLACKAEEGEE